jgi:YbbR domain-containing protein
MKRLLGNWELKILAVLAAIIFWALVIGTENTFYTLPDDIPIKAFNVPEDLVVAQELGTVKLRLKTNNIENIKNIKAEDFNAYIDLEGFTVGERDTEVQVSSKNTDVNVLRIEPSTVTVRIEAKAEKEVPVVYETQGNVKEGYEIKDVSIGEERAVIKGAQNILDDIDEAKIFIELNDEEEDITQTYPLKVFDEKGEEMTQVIIEPKELEVSLDIGLTSGQKLVGVQPSIIGTPQDNVWIKSIKVEPSYIVLSGDSEKVNDLEYVQTEDIHVNDLTENRDFDVSIIGVPEGVTVEGGGRVTVSVEVETYATEASAINKKTVNVPIVITKFRTDQDNKKVDPPSVTLVAEGAEDALNKLTSKLKVELDISEYESDDEKAKVQIGSNHFSLPEGVSMVKVTPSEVNVSW